MLLEELLEGVEVASSTQKKIEKVLMYYEKSKANRDHTVREKAASLIDEILADLFDNGYGFAIPKQFMDSKLGNFLFTIKYTDQYYYPTYDIEIILDRTKSNIYYLRRIGKLELYNRGGAYVASESELRRYMVSKMGIRQTNKHLKAFWRVKNKIGDKKVTKEEFKQMYKEEIKNG